MADIPNIKIGRIGKILKEVVDLQDQITALEQKNIKLMEAGQKLHGLLSNIKHETDYMSDSYYVWIDKVLNETDEILTEEDE